MCDMDDAGIAVSASTSAGEWTVRNAATLAETRRLYSISVTGGRLPLVLLDHVEGEEPSGGQSVALLEH